MSISGFSGSYAAEDVTFLLKPVVLEPTDIVAKEALIQSGARHYSEMLSPENPPEADYLSLYHQALARNGRRLATDVARLAASLDVRTAKTRDIVLVSLVRAGTPIGVLLTRALRRLGRVVVHYSISIIRDHGLDAVALRSILGRHGGADIVFVDGWTGKGTIADELRSSCAASFNQIDPFLVVIADPAGAADLAATHDDYLIASGLLNGIVSGLVSRSILRSDLVGPGDFHACVRMHALAAHDVSRAFVDHVDALVPRLMVEPLSSQDDLRAKVRSSSNTLVASIMDEWAVSSRNHVKPGIAEATRALLRRMTQRLFVRDKTDPDVQHLLLLAKRKGVAICHSLDTGHYRAVALLTSAPAEPE